MRKISVNTITKTVFQLCAQANINLRPDALSLLKRAYQTEKNPKAKKALAWIVENACVAKKEKLAICQDTGLPIVFLEVGQDLRFVDGDLNKAVQKGIESGYKKASLRNSIIQNPLRRGASKFTPGIVHFDLVKGNKLKITVLPKGFGCENKSALKMFEPTAGLDEVKKFILNIVKNAGPDACPPYIVGVGIGGSAEVASLLAKKALLKSLLAKKSKLEKELWLKINKLEIGPMGLGGKTTALSVGVETSPTHIAGLPVAVNISCHALRSASRTL